MITAPVASTLNSHFGDKMGLENQHVNEGCPMFVAHSLRAGGHSGSHANAGVMPAVAFAQNQRGELRTSRIASQLTTGGGKPGEGYPAVMTPSAVRRLTPLEAERLMGFPDDFTRIPYRGKPADKCPDGPRYKALGNSWAVNCADWLAERIGHVEAILQSEAA